MSYVEDNLDMFSRIIQCIAAQFGPSCEVVLHDMTKPYDHTIVAIENGYITNRKIGDSGTNIGLEVLRGTVENADRFNYVNQTPDGKILRSSSVYLRDEKGDVCGSICINFDTTDFVVASRCISHFARLVPDQEVVEDYTGNIDHLLDNLIRQAVGDRNVDEMHKEEKLQAVGYLDEKGAFLIKKAAEKIADSLKISKYTVYNYLEEIRGGKPGNGTNTLEESNAGTNAK